MIIGADVDRRTRLAGSITADQTGIEIGPYFNPILPKRNGYRCFVLDVFDAEALRKQAAADPNIPEAAIAAIEEVDLVGPANFIERLVVEKHQLGSFDYIVSSHNFEHMPDPIRFLQGCEQVLRPGGSLSMALPDKRTCFDYFRPHTILTEFIEAYFQGRDRPTAAQLFTQNSLHCRYSASGQQLASFSLDDDPANITPLETLREAFYAWQQYQTEPDDIYRDTHCWAFTPASCELIIHDLRFLGLINLEIVSATETIGHEFYMNLKKPDAEKAEITPEASYYRYRRHLLHRISDELSVNSPQAFAHRKAPGQENTDLFSPHQGYSAHHFKKVLGTLWRHRSSGLSSIYASARARGWSLLNLDRR